MKADIYREKKHFQGTLHFLQFTVHSNDRGNLFMHFDQEIKKECFQRIEDCLVMYSNRKLCFALISMFSTYYI